MYVPGTEDLHDGEVRVTVLGSGDPFVRRSQASGSLLIEVGNRERDFFFFDLGSGALANFSSMMLPVESTTKVFLSHLHADHVGDIPGLIGSIAKAGRSDPVEIWGGASEDPELGIDAFVRHTLKALAWDAASFRGAIPSSGCDAIPHEIPYDRSQKIYEVGGVTITSFPAIHGLSGAVGYALEYAGLRIVFSGDTRPCHFVTDAASGADLLIHECFQSPSIAAASFGIPVDVMAARLKPAHTLPIQMGRILEMTKPRMGALWHMDVTPGADAALAEVAESYDGAVVVSQDLTVFNVTADAVVARQAKVVEAPHPAHGPSKGVPTVEPPPPPPSWWAAAALDL
jgi:ribonuclease Z